MTKYSMPRRLLNLKMPPLHIQNRDHDSHTPLLLQNSLSVSDWKVTEHGFVHSM